MGLVVLQQSDNPRELCTKWVTPSAASFSDPPPPSMRLYPLSSSVLSCPPSAFLPPSPLAHSPSLCPQPVNLSLPSDSSSSSLPSLPVQVVLIPFAPRIECHCWAAWQGAGRVTPWRWQQHALTGHLLWICPCEPSTFPVPYPTAPPANSSAMVCL